MTRTTARLFALLFAASCFAAACGGKVAFDGSVSSDGASGATSTSGSTSTSAASSSTSTSASSSGVSACDGAVHTIDMTGFDLSCMVPSDCAPVFFGDFCEACVCPFSAINRNDLMKYLAESQAKQAGAPPSMCNCPASSVSCVQGVCAAHVP